MDIADWAQALTESEMEHLAAVRMPEGPKSSDECLYCGESLIGTERRWCNVECRDGWELENVGR